MIDLITLALAALTVALGIMNSRTTRRLDALRRNAFVTNEKGHRIRLERAESRCECSGQCGQECCTPRCQAMNYEPHPDTGSKVVLTVAHLDHIPENCGDDNLLAMCQRCHNRYDMPMRRAGI